MRIGIDGTFLEAESLFTGMGRYTLGLVRGLASFTNQHEIILLGYGFRPDILPETVHWHRLSRASDSRWLVWIQHQLLLPYAAAKLGLDLFHSPGVNMRLSRPGVPHVMPCPRVITVHDAIPVVYYGKAAPKLPWRLRLGYWLGLVAARTSAATITVSETSRRDLAHHTSLKANDIHVVHNGLDPLEAPENAQAIRRSMGLPDSYLLYAGSYEPRKNVLGAVEAYRSAMKQIELPPMVLLVERESGYRTQVMRAVHRHGPTDRLHFVHSLSEKELVALIAGASVLLYPSYYEGFGFPPLEAMTLGVPVITSDRGSLPEILGDAAYYADPDSAFELSEAIVTLLKNQSEADHLAKRGRQRAGRYRWQETARSTLMVYEQAAEEGDHPAIEREARRV